MNVQEILQALKSGDVTMQEAEKLLSIYAIEEVENYARIDTKRAMRRGGIPEIILAESKRIHETKEIARRMLEKEGVAVISRIRGEDYDSLISYVRGLGASVSTGRNASTILAHTRPIRQTGATVGILAAGTSDVGIAEEARIVCEATGCRCVTGYDVGVAGLQRIFPMLKEMTGAGAGCIIVVAGMEGALATLVSSLMDVPVIGVPTSVGYGYGQGGVAALASMLQSCSLGMAVVNIDGGAAAGSIASMIANRSRGAAPRGGGKNADGDAGRGKEEDEDEDETAATSMQAEQAARTGLGRT